MEKYIRSIITATFLLCSVAYGGEQVSAPNDQKISVNQIGEWEVITTMGNTCQDKRSVMYCTIDALNGDKHTMGSMICKGDFFAFDENGTCRLIPISDVTQLNAPSIMTKAEFKAYEWKDFTNKNSIKHFEVTHYSPKSISIEINYTDGSNLYQTFNRR